MPKWRNGRRARFRSVFPYGSGGSTPLFGTTDEKVATRFENILRELATAYLGKTIGVVTHGGALRVLLRRFGYVSHTQLRKGSVENVAYIKLESDGVEFFVKDTEGIELGQVG